MTDMTIVAIALVSCLIVGVWGVVAAMQEESRVLRVFGLAWAGFCLIDSIVVGLALL